MANSDLELERLLDEDVAPDIPAPKLIPTGWLIFLVLFAGFDVVCFVIGRVPWTGGTDGLHRLDIVFTLVIGTLVGFAVSLITEAVATSRAAALGLSREDSDLVADELSVLTRQHRIGRASVLTLIAAVWVICGIIAGLLFRHASLPVATVYVALHALVGLAIPVCWRNFKRSSAEFQVWLDEKNGAFEPEAAARAKAHRKHVAELIDVVRTAEDELRERCDTMPRVPAPIYLQPHAMWVLPALAIIVDIILLASPDARSAALAVDKAGVLLALWRMLGLWIQGCIVVGVVWALMSWYYVDIADQVSRQRDARDWSAGGLATYAVEAVIAALFVSVLIGLILIGGWAAPFVLWNLLLPTPILYGVLKDIKDTADEHYDRNIRKRADAIGPAPGKAGE